MNLKIILTAVETELFEAWKEFCGHFPNVEFHQGSILDLEADAIVSPANSFGFMDGGIDLIYSYHFGWELQEKLQNLIKTKHHGELIVGQADIIETENKLLPYLIAAPTMRVPMYLKKSINPYLAARAVFLLIKTGVFSEGQFAGKPINDVVKSVAFPGLGTGTGGIEFKTCAFQMEKAITHFVVGENPFPRSWSVASYEHQYLFSDKN